MLCHNGYEPSTWYQPVSELHALTLAAPAALPILFIRFPDVTLCEITKPNGRGDMTVLSVDYSSISHLATHTVVQCLVRFLLMSAV